MWLDKWFVGVNDRIFIKQRTCEYDQEMPQSGITDQVIAAKVGLEIF